MITTIRNFFFTKRSLHIFKLREGLVVANTNLVSTHSQLVQVADSVPRLDLHGKSSARAAQHEFSQISNKRFGIKRVD